MNRLFEKAGRMLRDNRRRRRLLGLATVAGAVVAVVCTALLMYPAHAITGGDTLRNAINDDSAVFWRPAGAGDAAWAKTDGGSALDAASELRLRVAFKLPAGTLADGTTLQYRLPSSVHPDMSAGALKGDVFASPTVGDASRPRRPAPRSDPRPLLPPRATRTRRRAGTAHRRAGPRSWSRRATSPATWTSTSASAT